MLRRAQYEGTLLGTEGPIGYAGAVAAILIPAAAAARRRASAAPHRAAAPVGCIDPAGSAAGLRSGIRRAAADAGHAAAAAGLIARAGSAAQRAAASIRDAPAVLPLRA